jgi:hypothetical protein
VLLGRLFKYVTPHIAKLMTGRGSVRIGTLREYQAMEATGDVRGDAGEGTRITTSACGPGRYEDGSFVHRWLLSKGICVKGAIVTSGENAVVHELRHPDCFVYCVSERFSPELMREFGGACVVVTNPTLFFQALHAHLCERLRANGHQAPECVVGRCFYVERRQPFCEQTTKHPCFVKPVHFRDEAEVRALWVSDGGAIAPVIMEIPELVAYLAERQEANGA